MNNKQLMALSDAAARSLGSGLENGGETWTGGSVAHITDVGMLALEDQREQHRSEA